MMQLKYPEQLYKDMVKEKPMLSISDLIGEWKLESFEIMGKNNTPHQWGKNTHGILIYTSNGYMSVSINREHKPINSASDAKFKDILFYTGTYEIKDQKIIHHVKNASDINRIGKSFIRDVIFEDEKLQLLSSGEFGTASLIWKKIDKKKS